MQVSVLQDEKEKLKIEVKGETPTITQLIARQVWEEEGEAAAIREHPFMVEESTIPQARFPGLAQESEIPSSIVVLAHRYGVLLARAEEKIGVTRAEGDVAEALKVAEGTPLLKLDCVVYAIDGRPIEWRVARCHLRDNYYMTEIHSGSRSRKV